MKNFKLTDISVEKEDRTVSVVSHIANRTDELKQLIRSLVYKTANYTFEIEETDVPQTAKYKGPFNNEADKLLNYDGMDSQILRYEMSWPVSLVVSFSDDEYANIVEKANNKEQYDYLLHYALVAKLGEYLSVNFSIIPLK